MRIRPLTLGALGVAVLGLLVGVGLGIRLLSRPDGADAVALDPGAGLRFQRAVAELLLRQGGLSSRQDPVIVSGSELTAFLSQHLVIRRMALRPVLVQVGPGWVRIVGRTSAGQLAGRGRVPVLLPGALADLEVWLGVRGHVQIAGGTARFVMDGASIGRQAVPPSWLWALVGQRPDDLLVWRLPSAVERVELGPGRIVVHTRRGARG
jgi:hypothetical protein